MIPGANILNQALTIISRQSFGYLKFIERITNDIGIDVPSFEPEIILSGSVQPVPRDLFQHLGLDWKKNYIMIYEAENITGVGRGSSGDRVIFDGKVFQVLSENDWSTIDGWAGIMCVEIDP